MSMDHNLPSRNVNIEMTDKHAYEFDHTKQILRIYPVRLVMGESTVGKKPKVVIDFKREFKLHPRVRDVLWKALRLWATS